MLNGMGRGLVLQSSHTTNRQLIPNWGLDFKLFKQVIFPLTKYPTKSKPESVTHRISATLSGFIRMVFVPYFPLYFVASLSLVLFKPGAETVTVTGEGEEPARRMARHEPLNSF